MQVLPLDSCGKSGEGEMPGGASRLGGGVHFYPPEVLPIWTLSIGQELHRGALLQCKPFVGILIQRLSVTILHLPAQEISVTTPNQLQAHGRSSLIGTV